MCIRDSRLAEEPIEVIKAAQKLELQLSDSAAQPAPMDAAASVDLHEEPAESRARQRKRVQASARPFLKRPFAKPRATVGTV